MTFLHVLDSLKNPWEFVHSWIVICFPFPPYHDRFIDCKLSRIWVFDFGGNTHSTSVTNRLSPIFFKLLVINVWKFLKTTISNLTVKGINGININGVLFFFFFFWIVAGHPASSMQMELHLSVFLGALRNLSNRFLSELLWTLVSQCCLKSWYENF